MILVDGTYGYADRSGEIVVSFRQAEAFSEGPAVLGDGTGRYWYSGSRQAAIPRVRDLRIHRQKWPWGISVL